MERRCPGSPRPGCPAFTPRSLAFSIATLAAVAPGLAQSRSGAGPAVGLPTRPLELIELRSKRVGPVEVSYLELPWGPKTMAQIESDEANSLNRRAWPFARLELRSSAAVAGTKLEPGTYALILRRAKPPLGVGLEVEFRRTTDADFLMPGVSRVRVPDGEAAVAIPARLRRVEAIAPRLAVALQGRGASIRLSATYGDRLFATDLRIR